MALAVYMAFRTVAENLKTGEIAPLLSLRRFIEFGYLEAHFPVTLPRAARAFFSSGA